VPASRAGFKPPSMVGGASILVRFELSCQDTWSIPFCGTAPVGAPHRRRGRKPWNQPAEFRRV